MRKLSIILGIFFLLCLFSFSAFAQTPQQMEQDLVKSLEEVSKHGTYAGNYDEKSSVRLRKTSKINS